MTGKKTEKQNVFNSFLYTDDDPGLVHVWTIFFLPFFFSFSFSGHTNNHRVYIPPPDSFIIILIINKKEKKTNNNVDGFLPLQRQPIISSFVFRYHRDQILSPSTGSLRIAIADRRAQPFGTLLLTICLQGV